VGCAGWVAFAPGTTEVRMRLAVSYVDPEGAWANLREEHPDYDAEARLAEVEAAWRGLLSRVRVAGGTEDERVAFHTALYHSLIMPTRFTDVDGRYRGVDQAVHTADFDYLTDLSLWDTFRTLHPLWLLAWPEHQRSAIRSLIRMGEDGGALARWPLGHGYTGGMVGTPAQQVMAESYLKGLDGWDAEAAFDLAWPASIGPQVAASRGGVGEYVELGYVPVEDGGGSVSRTLEYAWSDHAMARWAEAMGREEEAAVAWTLADNWQGVWSDEWDFFIGRRRDGSFTWEEDVRFDWRSEYVEGNAWHYVWMMPQDVAGLIEVQHGGDRAAFLDRYRTYWQDVADEPDDGLPDDFYWHGNEPVMHYAFLGSLAGAPDLTADAARWVLANRYDATPLGLDGNDDSGTLSAWYALAAMGLFPVSGTEVYAVASPLFERSEIDREDGSMLVIRAPGASAAGRYVQRAWLGSEPLDRASLTHAEWVQAGEVILELGPERGAWAADGAAPAP
jgi:predicted alpha-1,2-mannosidase